LPQWRAKAVGGSEDEIAHAQQFFRRLTGCKKENKEEIHENKKECDEINMTCAGAKQ
jgi:hypothetical protein